MGPSQEPALVVLSVRDGRPAIRGECEMSNAPAIEAWLAGFDGGPLDVDLSGVSFFDSAALRAVLNARRSNQHFRIVNPSHKVLRVLEITGTVEYLVDVGTSSRPRWNAAPS